MRSMPCCQSDQQRTLVGNVRRHQMLNIIHLIVNSSVVPNSRTHSLIPGDGCKLSVFSEALPTRAIMHHSLHSLSWLIAIDC